MKGDLMKIMLRFLFVCLNIWIFEVEGGVKIILDC